MLEIIALVFLCQKMGKMLRAKGWKPGWMQVLVVVTWFGAMVFAAFAYGIYLAIAHGPEAPDEIGLAVYPWMLLAAVLGQLALFGLARVLPTKASVENPFVQRPTAGPA